MSVFDILDRPNLRPEDRAMLEQKVEKDTMAYEMERDEVARMGMMPDYETEAEREYNCELLRSYGFDPENLDEED